jgi:ABC-type glycerol-3-phosphate transport system substrate-binding protein
MQYKGKQYGLTYYSDYMAFFYDEEKLTKAGISAPPKTWEEVVQQSLKIKQAGLSEYPLMLSMARESWLIEFLTALVYSHGGRFVDDAGNAVMQDPKKGAHQALQWIVDAVQKHKIISPACVELGELNGLKAFSSGNHAFAMLGRYRVRSLNDPKQSQIAGRVKQALMPAGFVILGIRLGKCDRGQLLDQLIDADATCSGKCLQPLVLRVRQSDRESRHVFSFSSLSASWQATGWQHREIAVRHARNPSG